jgi:hypothetical protein
MKLLLPLGAFLATLIKFYYVTVVTFLEIALFSYIILPTVLPLSIPATGWLTMLGNFLFSGFSFFRLLLIIFVTKFL